MKSTHNTNSMGSRAKCHQLVYDSQKHPATSDVGGIPRLVKSHGWLHDELELLPTNLPEKSEKKVESMSLPLFFAVSQHENSHSRIFLVKD